MNGQFIHITKPNPTTNQNKNKLLEKLAELEHEQWIEWTRYMLQNLTEENIVRWKKQIGCSYSNLPNDEKWSDRRWAKKVLEIISQEKN